MSIDFDYDFRDFQPSSIIAWQRNYTIAYYTEDRTNDEKWDLIEQFRNRFESQGCTVSFSFDDTHVHCKFVLPDSESIDCCKHDNINPALFNFENAVVKSVERIGTTYIVVYDTTNWKQPFIDLLCNKFECRFAEYVTTTYDYGTELKCYVDVETC